MPLKTQLWLRISLINLCLVAALGVLMRYKIGFAFPYFEQKSLQHAHSHFAFAGWVSHTIMVLMVYFLQCKAVGFKGSGYNKILIGNLVSAYGMLVFFIVQGYGLVSIFFSVASIVLSYLFARRYWKDLKKLDDTYLSKYWFKAALGFNVLSSIGTFVLAYLMATKTVNEAIYLGSIYFYLHFQYNGWFFFACMGLLYGLLDLRKNGQRSYTTCFVLFTLAAIPAYFLSTLWLELPVWLYGLTVFAASVQFFAWLMLTFIFFKEKQIQKEKFTPLLRYILLFVAFALTVKLALQLASVIPALGKLAFGFRPIVIAYLHLVLLAVISLFLLFYIYTLKLFQFTPAAKIGLAVFATAVLLNEIVLGLQGIGALSYTVIPYANEWLFAIALLLFSAMLALTLASEKTKV